MIDQWTIQLHSVLQEATWRLLVGSTPGPAVEIEHGLPAALTAALYKELRGSDRWREELWVLDDQEQVKRVGAAEFTASRRPFSNCWAIPESQRSSLSTLSRVERLLASRAVVEAVSTCFGKPMEFISLDVALYRQGRFLSRHADLFGGRVLGMVFFLSPGWKPGCGGELMVWDQDGDCQSVAPRQGSVAAFPIHPLYSHAVSEVRSKGWERLSMAAHFGTPEGDPTMAWGQARALAQARADVEARSASTSIG